MFGKNPIRKRTDNPLELEVESVFNTIQGEGPFAGMPAVFIRLSGCNLACTFCDTEFEEGMGKFTPVEDIVAQVQKYPKHFQRLVVITGGEPLRQNIALLVDMLLRHAGSQTYTVQLETAGTLWDPRLTIPALRGELVIVCSPKTPKVNADLADLCHHWKYIIRTGDQQLQGLPASSTQQQITTGVIPVLQPLFQRLPWRETDTIWVSPCDEHDEIKNRDNLELTGISALRYGYRVSLQMHKLLGVE